MNKLFSLLTIILHLTVKACELILLRFYTGQSWVFDSHPTPPLPLPQYCNIAADVIPVNGQCGTLNW